MKDPRAPLDPQVQALFELMAPGREARVLEAKALREGFAELEPFLNADSPQVARESEIRIPGPAGELRALVFEPEGAGPHPVLLLLHGGGWVIMSPESHARLARTLCVDAGLYVVSLDYRMAPEDRYPAALDDCVAAVRWLRASAASLGVDARRLALAGDSAGGQLSAATTLRLLTAGEEPPRALALLCPVCDMALDTESYRTLSPDDPVLDDAIMRFFRDSWVDPEQWDDPCVSPLRASSETLAGFPPTLVLAAGIDPLRDEALRFADRLREAQVDVSLVRAEGMPHDFMLFPGIDAGPRALARVTTFLRTRLG
ncbi:MAG: alpha/beta hydrolase [Myxococcota bacterium]